MSTRKAALLRAIRGPIMLLTLGSLFAWDHSGGLAFTQSFPLLLIVYGVLKLLERTAVSAADPGGTE
ncbi:MAG: hypothetical protein NZ554_01275 [Bryobacteraceae bacterium]|nr:hypothetical protein [Bryobacteraceae bacterium]